MIHWDLEKLLSVRRFEAEMLYFPDEDTLQDVGGVRRIIFDIEGKTLVACGGKPSSGGFVRATPMARFFDWELGTTLDTRAFGGDKAGFIHDAVYHADGYLIGTTSGQPGEGQLFFWRPGEAEPFFLFSKMPNCQSVAVHPNTTVVAVASTSKKSSNGRDATTDEAYDGNFSPINLWDLKSLIG